MSNPHMSNPHMLNPQLISNPHISNPYQMVKPHQVSVNRNLITQPCAVTQSYPMNTPNYTPQTNLSVQPNRMAQPKPTEQANRMVQAIRRRNPNQKAQPRMPAPANTTIDAEIMTHSSSGSSPVSSLPLMADSNMPQTNRGHGTQIVDISDASSVSSGHDGKDYLGDLSEIFPSEPEAEDDNSAQPTLKRKADNNLGVQETELPKKFESLIETLRVNFEEAPLGFQEMLLHQMSIITMISGKRDKRQRK
ncbi:hypothetical protein JCM33374_g1587 [Metschnikowia sp. JCM 33374]|nr:hypothetical protein JCM33374_g1587 [Metschnikowia sp. JCM 33374]